MNETKKKELIKNLTTREVIDDYEERKGKRRIVLLIVLIIISGIIIYHNYTSSKKLKSSRYETCKIDDCKTFKKKFIEEVRYGYTTAGEDMIFYNCGNKKYVDQTNTKCYKKDSKEKCSAYEESKKYCYAFTTDNVKKEKNLYLVNPKYLSNIDKFTSLEAVYIDVDENTKDLNELFNSIIKASNSNKNAKIYVFINKITDKNIKNITSIDEKYENINICLFDKDLCLQTNTYASLNDLVNVIINIKEINNELYSKFEKPTSVEKALFVYSYIINNYKVDKNAAKEEMQLSEKNFADVSLKKSIAYNKAASHHAFASYYKAVLNYLGIEANIVSTTDLKTKTYHDLNQIKIDDTWYNTDISLDAINKQNHKNAYEYFLKSDDDFNHDDYSIESPKNKSTESYNKEKITEIINKL